MNPTRLLSSIIATLLMTMIHLGPAHAQDLYWINGTDMGAKHNHVQVWGPIDPVLDATVTVNGTPLSNGGTSGTYSGELPAWLSPGETLTLVVQIGDSTITGVDVVPEPPVVTEPADASEFGPLDAIHVAWTSSTDPEIFAVRVEFSGSGERWDVSGDLRSFDIPIGILPVNQPMVVKVFSYNNGQFTGPYAPGSEMSIRGSNFVFPTVTIVDLTSAQPTTWGAIKVRYE